MIIFAATKGYEFITFSNKNKYSMPPLVNLFCQNSHNFGQNTEIQNTKISFSTPIAGWRVPTVGYVGRSHLKYTPSCYHHPELLSIVSLILMDTFMFHESGVECYEE